MLKIRGTSRVRGPFRERKGMLESTTERAFPTDVLSKNAVGVGEKKRGFGNPT